MEKPCGPTIGVAIVFEVDSVIGCERKDVRVNVRRDLSQFPVRLDPPEAIPAGVGHPDVASPVYNDARSDVRSDLANEQQTSEPYHCNPCCRSAFHDGPPAVTAADQQMSAHGSEDAGRQ